MSIVKIPVFGAQPYGFKATDVIGCKAWFDAADVSTLYNQLPVEGMLGFSDYTSANEQRVTVWEDKSDGGNDMIRNVNPENMGDTSAIYMGPPIVAPDSYALPLAVVNFPQTDSGGSNSNAPSFLQQNLVAVGAYPYNESARGPRVGTGISATTDIFVVVKPKYLNVAGDVFSIGTRTTDGTQDFTCLSITSSGYWKINSQAAARDVTGDTAEVFNTFSNIRGPDPNYRILHMSLSNNNYVLRRNGSQIGSANRTWSPTLSDYRYYMGRRNASSTPGNYFDGRLGEVIVYNNIITTEKRLIVESYLANKWNLIDLLPSDHPAKSQNTPIYLGGKSMAEEQNGFIRRAVIIKIFVQGPSAPTITTSEITIGGAIFAITWSPNGATPDYYLVTIQQSTNDSTWTTVAYNSRYLTTTYNHQIGSIDNKYYRAIIQSRNSGGTASTTSTSLLNSTPAPPTPSPPTITGSDLNLAWTPVYPGGIPDSYSVYLNENNILINTYSSITNTYYTPAVALLINGQYKFKVSATNIIGTSAQSAFSETITYTVEGGGT